MNRFPNSGLDPEILVLDPAGQIVAAERLVGPPVRDSSGTLCPLSYDNAAIEFRPRHSHEVGILIGRTTGLFNDVRSAVRKAVRAGLAPTGTTISFVPAARLREEDRRLESVRSFGCSPSGVVGDDLDVSVVAPNVTADDTDVRSAGFHIHTELADPSAAVLAVAVMDGLLGLSDVLRNQQLGWSEASQLRRQHLGYGKAGEHRIRDVSGVHVLEYRAMSPWVLSSNASVRTSVNVARSICKRSFDDLLPIVEKFPKRAAITKAVNEADAASAEALLRDCTTIWART